VLLGEANLLGPESSVVVDNTVSSQISQIPDAIAVPVDLARLTTEGGGPAVPRGAEYEWIVAVLNNPSVREAICTSSFNKYARSHRAILQDSETASFSHEVCKKLHLPAPAPKKLANAISQFHRAQGGGLSAEDFPNFFVRFLRAMAAKLEVQLRACIFLDVDGVLLPFGGACEEPQIPRRCLDALARVLAEAAEVHVYPRIVLSSTWRCSQEQVETLRAVFRDYGTPLDDIAALKDMTRVDLHIGRLEEIADWLDVHPEVQRFVVLDDDAPLPQPNQRRSTHTVDMLERFKAHVVSPKSQEGLTEADADFAIALLSAQRNQVCN